MEQWFNRKMEQGREFRKRKLAGIARILLNIGFTSSRMTFLSLLVGLGAAYFLFQRQSIYIVLVLLHLLADGLDGVIASLEIKPQKGGVNWKGGMKWTHFGKYFDSGTDAFITLLVLGKVAFTLQDIYGFIVVGLFALAQLIYFASRMEAPVLMVRTVTLVLLMLYIPASVPPLAWTNQLLLLVMGIAGVASLYSLARQLQWGMEKKVI